VIAQTLLDHVAAGDPLELFQEHFPTVSSDDAVEFLKLAHDENHSG
jgi:uncharacterized protein (DUF433 family)